MPRINVPCPDSTLPTPQGKSPGSPGDSPRGERGGAFLGGRGTADLRPQRIREEGADTREVWLQDMLMSPGTEVFLFFPNDYPWPWNLSILDTQENQVSELAETQLAGSSFLLPFSHGL